MFTGVFWIIEKGVSIIITSGVEENSLEENLYHNLVDKVIVV